MNDKQLIERVRIAARIMRDEHNWQIAGDELDEAANRLEALTGEPARVSMDGIEARLKSLEREALRIRQPEGQEHEFAPFANEQSFVSWIYSVGKR